ncbi:transcriptional regulator, LacI family [Clostridium cavendishii DSM 21758]|uniref:Transcriptional regulator, LacI family n=1 Tax=Clostridium cavendishii DSM 21758 TaxID=1121302 RepID=A0A1M6BGW0_9CLOT|nr:LacI family DNA-binding transcriptional regulator [Clostridium cavendishii]SHI47945.1 transcriptional regulator, LacI family [Clostridium cavendishii DSM 21758]
MSVTIKDVAREANVAPSTVSRVLAGNPRISEATKIRVMEVVEKLNYHPNVIARSLVNNTTRTLGLILPTGEDNLFKNPFFIQVMTGISVYAQKRGYSIMYAFSKDEDEELNFIIRYINSKQVDGIILLTSRTNDKCIKYLKSEDFKFVVIGRPDEQEDILWVDNDNVKAMEGVVEDLIVKGNKSIAFIGAGKELNVSIDRLLGYKNALKKHNIVYDKKLVMQMNDFNEEEGAIACNKILKYKIPDAIVTTDDLLAFGANKSIKNNNIKEHIDILGFNNTPLAEYQIPSLSSVDINAKKLGYYAAKILIDNLENKHNDETNYIIETNLVRRDSIR